MGGIMCFYWSIFAFNILKIYIAMHQISANFDDKNAQDFELADSTKLL